MGKNKDGGLGSPNDLRPQSTLLSLDGLLTQSQPDFLFCKSPLDAENVNRTFYFQTCCTSCSLSVEVFSGVKMSWNGLYTRDLTLLEFPNLFLAVSHEDFRVEYVLAYETEDIFGVKCATRIKQWKSSRMMSITGVPEVRPQSTSSFIMTERLLRRFPVFIRSSRTASRFWWWRFADAQAAGYVIYEMDGTCHPIELSGEQLRDRGWEQPIGREFPGYQRAAIIAKSGTW